MNETARLRIALATSCLISIAVAAGCRSVAHPNVVLILVDTLRADHLSLYGYERKTSPHLDRLAETAFVFEDAHSGASCTFPSVNSILTSKHPVYFLGQDGHRKGLLPDSRSLAEAFAEAGFRTLAVSASPIVRHTPSKNNPHGGFGKGFDLFDEDCLWKPAACVNKKALSLLDDGNDASAPFFLYLHYMDPHDPYRPPKSSPKRFNAPYDGHAFIARGDPNPIARALYVERGVVDVQAQDLKHLELLYDEEIAYFDTHLEVLLDALRERGLLENAVILLASDHGEEFMEHDLIKHCRGVFDTVTRTPLVLWLSGAEEGAHIDHPVQNLDIAPTLLDLASVPFDRASFDGRSLRPLMDGTGSHSRYAFSSQGVLRSVYDGHHKLVVNRRTKRARLFDLDSDPREMRDVSGEEPRVVQRLTRMLKANLRAIQDDDAERSIRLAEDAEQQLRALGYLQ